MTGKESHSEGRCLGCGKPGMKQFRSSGRYKKYCTPECRLLALATSRAAAPQATRVCTKCGEGFTVSSVSKRSACAPCSRRVRRSTPSVACGHCYKTYTPRNPKYTSYCSRDCAYAHRQKPPSPDAYAFRCKGCDEWATSKRPDQVYCTASCRDGASYRRNVKLQSGTVVCRFCGGAFAVKSRASRRRYCSRRCEVRAGKAARRALRRHNDRLRELAAQAGESVPPTEIFIRDGYRCQYCKCKVRLDVGVPHPRRATLDHIVPISRGGPHTRANLQTACWNCNCCVKRDRAVGNQMRLF